MKKIYKKLLDSIQLGEPITMISNYEKGNISKVLHNQDLNGDKIFYKHEDNKISVTERYVSKPRLIVLGGGHIALPLCLFGKNLDFYVVVCDDRPFFANNNRFPNADQVICDTFENAINQLKLKYNDYVVIVTRGHKHDYSCLQTIINSDVFPCYVGMIGSKRRAKIVIEQISHESSLKERISKIHTPIGLSIGAVTPEEIALSIMSEIVQEKNSINNYKNNTLVEFSPDLDIINWIIKNEEEKGILVTILSTSGSTPRRTGAKMLLTPYGQIIGSIGGGCSEAYVIQEARSIVQDFSYGTIDIDLSDSAEDDGMVCGGKMTVLIEEICSIS